MRTLGFCSLSWLSGIHSVRNQIHSLCNTSKKVSRERGTTRVTGELRKRDKKTFDIVRYCQIGIQMSSGSKI